MRLTPCINLHLWVNSNRTIYVDTMIWSRARLSTTTTTTSLKLKCLNRSHIQFLISSCVCIALMHNRFNVLFACTETHAQREGGGGERYRRRVRNSGDQTNGLMISLLRLHTHSRSLCLSAPYINHQQISHIKYMIKTLLCATSEPIQALRIYVNITSIVLFCLWWICSTIPLFSLSLLGWFVCYILLLLTLQQHSSDYPGYRNFKCART